MANAPKPAVDPPTDLQKLQFDYAWKWFNFHADQRQKMFNFMLIITGIFAAGVLNALDKKLPSVALASLCFIAGILALIFRVLDLRNRDLVWLGEDVLMDLERKGIFGQGTQVTGRYDKLIYFGILSRQALEEKSANRSKIGDALCGKHRVLLPLVAYLIAVLFFVAGILILRYWPIA